MITMAINSNDVLGERNPIRSISTSKTSNLSSCRLIQINFAGKDSSSTSKANRPNNIKDIKSPYFTNDKVHLLSRVTAKKCVRKKPTDIVSSFPLAANLYKANSDEFKLKKRGCKKVKKSVLTLPNDPVPIPKTYTVSDLNDSEYLNAANDSRPNKPKKRHTIKRNKKCRLKGHGMEFCDRDARYCSQLNIDLDCSSSEVVNFTGDGEKISKISYNSNNSRKGSNYPHDVWAVLRDINKFQFRSPPTSQKSVIPLRKRRPITRMTHNSNDTHFIETCHTEEIAYISSFAVDSKSHESCSLSSSFDRVTVIDKQSEHNEIIQQFSQSLFGSNLNYEENLKTYKNNQNNGKSRLRLRNCNKKLSHFKKKAESNQITANNTPIKSLEVRGETLATKYSKSLLSPDLEATFKTSILQPVENCYFCDGSRNKEGFSMNNQNEINVSQKGVRSGDVYKCNNMKSPINSSSTKVNLLKPIGDLKKELNGITKVILTKGQELVSSSSAEPQRRPRLALTLPNTNIPKLSRFEIKRRLANQKFPIVILGKDQLTNCGIYVPNDETPQFDGLDKHIWPFMLKRSQKRIKNKHDELKKEIMKSNNEKFKHKIHDHNNMPINSFGSNHNTISSKKADECKKKKYTFPSANNQMQLATEITSHVVERPKPLFHLKNKMFQFLHKNPASTRFSDSNWHINQRIESGRKDKLVGSSRMAKKYITLNNKCSLTNVPTKEVLDKSIENKIVTKLYSPLRHPWAKGKWASDFIENIIKKIRSGVYYTVDRRDKKYTIHGTEVSTQTEINSSKNVCCQNSDDMDLTINEELMKDDPLKNILEFDKALTTLEIETINTNQIAIKHCITNVVVQFDIEVLAEAKSMTHTKKSMSCIPVHIKNNQEKVFKCNTSIINAILPAELCSILPTMMRTILDAENKLFLKPTPVQILQSNLTAISELSEIDNHPLIMRSLKPEHTISKEIRIIMGGQFSKGYTNDNIEKGDLLCSSENSKFLGTLFPNLNTQILSYHGEPSFNLHMTLNTSIEPADQKIKKYNCCRALELYNSKQFSIVPFYGYFNVYKFIQQIVDRINENGVCKIEMMLNNLKCVYNLTANSTLFSRKESQNRIAVLHFGNVGVISHFIAITRSVPDKREKEPQTFNTIEDSIDKKASHVKSVESKTVKQNKGRPSKVLGKKTYARFYRKCNSLSSIANYKCTPLNRVTNLEEFCQLLGSNLVYNVLDGCLERKILGAVEEMKNWMTDISPKQALLILLLANKKDTPNLIRFRPVLLQGIAVNRITKASELDTEIEVIERENFHKLTQYEGISYLPASTKNQDSLFEELYWIAKTTASDYQKTFDESSEKLLKSLLQKRKKLNPSYLRVMARYVGLGLLASTK